MRRVNENGDWKKLDALVKQIKVYGKVVQDLERDRITALHKLQDLLVEAYNTAPEVDTFFVDSPIGKGRVLHNLEAYQKKLGFEGAKVLTPSIEILDFAETIEEGCKWLLKFKKNEKAS